MTARDRLCTHLANHPEAWSEPLRLIAEALLEGCPTCEDDRRVRRTAATRGTDTPAGRALALVDEIDSALDSLRTPTANALLERASDLLRELAAEARP